MPMLSRILAFITLTAFVLLSALLQSTSPSTVHPIGILFIFVLFYLLALGVLTFFIFGVSRILNRLYGRGKLFEKNMVFREAYYYASVMALAPVLLVAMRSIGRGDIVDIALVVAFEIVACFYVARRR